MFKSYLKIAVRNLWKDRAFSIINISGLTLGLTICLMIFLYVRLELSYDTFHYHTERTYRLLRMGDLNDERYLIGATSAPFADALLNDFPNDIESATRVFNVSGLVSQGEDKNFIENKVILVDSNFLETFNFPLAIGQKETALSLPNSIIITEEMRRKYFGDEDPVNQIITVDNQLDFIVTGIFEETTNRSHLEFDFVANWAPLKELGFLTDWRSNALYTYVTLKPEADPEILKSKFGSFMTQYFGEDFQRMGHRIGLTLQPLTDVYFENEIRYDDVLHGDMQVIYIFIAVAIFIFIIACVNFMNLSTAKSLKRAKEVGVRKTLGSSKSSLIFQFFMEAFIISGAAVTLAFTLYEICLPWFNYWYFLELEPLRDVKLIIPMAFGLALFTGSVAGLYPALVLSSFKPVRILKGKSGLPGGGALRKVLVVLQFTISIILIVFTLVLRNQISYINEVDLGFEKDRIVLLELNYNTINQNIQLFMERLQASPLVEEVSLSSGVPGGFHGTMSFKVEGRQDQPKMRTLFTDENYIPIYELELFAGRNFSRDFKTDMEQSIILNEKAANELGWTSEQAIDQRLLMSMIDSTYRRVIGVVKDYNFSSLKTEVEPLAIAMTDQESLLSIKLNAGGSVNESITRIEDEWAKFVSFKPHYYFLEQSLQNLYQTERLQGRIFHLFAAISIFVACLGIFGLASFTAAQRSKEISIRKVLGASVERISALLTTDYLRMVLLSSAISIPISWYLGNKWLEGFAYKISISPVTFLIGLVTAFLVATFSVLFQSLRVATANPVQSLKEE